eukprot:239278-Amphidinium_carterae.3
MQGVECYAGAILEHRLIIKRLPSSASELQQLPNDLGDLRASPMQAAFPSGVLIRRQDYTLAKSLILRPFDKFLFQRRAAEGPTYLLKHLRGEIVDWEAYREGKHPHRTCSQCGLERINKGFSASQWAGVSSGRDAVCLTCEQGKTSDVDVVQLNRRMQALVFDADLVLVVAVEQDRHVLCAIDKRHVFVHSCVTSGDALSWSFLMARCAALMLGPEQACIKSPSQHQDPSETCAAMPFGQQQFA